MNILSVVSYYHPHWTGLTKYVVALNQGLAARGHQVTVLTTRHRSDLARRQTVNGVRVVRLRPLARVSRGMITPGFSPTVARLIKSHHLVHVHSPLPEALQVALLCRLLHRPLVMTHHGDVIMPAGVFNRVLQAAALGILTMAGRLSQAVVAYSRDYARHSPLLLRLREKVCAIYPPVEIPPPDLQEARAWRRRLGLEGKLLIGFAGRWVEEKGFDYLLKAFPLVRAVYPQAHLVYAGQQHMGYEDFYRRCRSLVEAVRPHLTFLGLIEDPRKLSDFYAMCDLFVLPSRSDNLALVQVEAMLCGTPVVAADIPGARVVVGETGFGRLCPPFNHQALARTILEVLGHLERYQPRPRAVRKVFDTGQTLDRYEQLMEKLYARHPISTTSRLQDPAP